jgi:hypothetical protein
MNENISHQLKLSRKDVMALEETILNTRTADKLVIMGADDQPVRIRLTESPQVHALMTSVNNGESFGYEVKELMNRLNGEGEHL